MLTRVDGCEALAPSDRKRCDFVLFFESGKSTQGRPRRWAVPIELKSGTVKARDLEAIHEQIQCGADVARKLMSAVGGGAGDGGGQQSGDHNGHVGAGVGDGGGDGGAGGGGGDGDAGGGHVGEGPRCGYASATTKLVTLSTSPVRSCSDLRYNATASSTRDEASSRRTSSACGTGKSSSVLWLNLG